MLYHGSPYGKKTIPIYDLLAKKHGFEVIQIEVPHPGNAQSGHGLQIRRIHPDYVVLRGSGVMNPVALTPAQRNGFPADHIVGNVWSNSEEDVKPAGDAAIGCTAITTQASGNQYPVLQDIIKTVYDAGKGNLDDKSRIGSVLVRGGAVTALIGDPDTVAERIDEYRRIGIDSVTMSGYRHLEEAYPFGELVLPNLPLSHPIPRCDIAVHMEPFGETLAGDHKPGAKLQAAR